MGKVKFVSVFVLLALLVSVVPGAVMGRESPPQNGPSAVSSVRNCRSSACFHTELSAEPISDWLRYEDPDYAFTLEYPAEWKVETTIQQSVPFSDPSAIIKRQTFSGPEGSIDLDVWFSKGYDLDRWLNWYGKTRNELATTHANATIAGQPAVVFVENGVTVDMLTAFFSDGQYVYRLWYTITHNERGAQTYWYMLNTFTLPGREKVITAQVSEEVERRAQQAVADSRVLLGNSCCGHYSSYCSVYFSCCSDQGNCTWWACYKFGAVPFRGDAGTWWGQVPDYPDWSRSTGSPRRYQENIAWWSGSPGHVAYVANYTGGNDTSITEMLWCQSCYRARTIPISGPSGYICEKYPPQP
ncbi:MAG: hypothetical protein DRI37_07470 [Chloroflexi bacterium]|nr:MAG: hypothetical protein DRI37_07470 [Chloroflexota bacterium]